MTLIDGRDAPPHEAAPAPGPSWPAARLRDLGFGIRFASSGGREGWIRTLLTAVGVGIGVALLLVASSVPHLLEERDARSRAREEARTSAAPDARTEKSDTTVLRLGAETEFRGRAVAGFLMRAEGTRPVLPPGIPALPADGAMYVSPALRELLASSEGRLLRERLPYAITGTIGDAGLVSPDELRYYAGRDALTAADGGHRLAAYGDDGAAEPLAPLLVVLLVMVCVVLLVPVGLFIATAVRFGGERRDRRLAALRLVGADIRTTRWMAAGEALFGAVLGLLVGLGIFLVARSFAGSFRVWNVSAFPADLVPGPWFSLLVAVSVPLCAVLVTLAAMRAVVVEPLGVERGGRHRGRRLWWRLVMPLAGAAVLLHTGRVDEFTPVRPAPIAVGATLVLFGLALLLPWLVEVCVRRLRGGPVSWQLAVRRLQSDSATATRAVSGVTVAVAGAVALQMIFAAMGDEFTRITGEDPSRAQFSITSEHVTGDAAVTSIEAFRATEGVRKVIGTVEAYATRPGHYTEDQIQPTAGLTVGDCGTLREIARIGACEEGDVFVAHPANDPDMSAWVDRTARKGEVVQVDSYSGGEPLRWTLPADARTVTGRRDPRGEMRDGILATVGAIDPATLPSASVVTQVLVDEDVEDVSEYVRNTAVRLDPGARVVELTSTVRSTQYATIQTGLQVGSTLVLLLIAASLLVQQIEQLRERRRVLSVLVAFGTRRSTLARSVLWQTAVPVVVGLATAVAGGLGLGAMLTWMIGKEVTRWWVFLPMAGAGAALIVLVTLVALPPLYRMTRPSGLRTE
ncbi:ABC transporter permease [uncultured Streptomyces sp.]|uniref:ABC transporter permease n=1 Tax=uncultured Streptomyces sp. TaxID=174707 RepID=UPI00263663C4|nr:FtsX-like permease family protein [uncultured Streptomyces sp.]